TSGAGAFQPMWLGLLAEAQRNQGQAKEALSVIDEALTVAQKTKESVWTAELYRLKGKLTLQSKVQSLKSKSLKSDNLQSEAEAYFRQAIEIARRQSAKSLELRAVMSLSRLWHQQGKKKQAHQTLA